MGSVSIWHWIVVGIVVMLLFGRGKISDLMGDVAKGIKSFKTGMADDEAEAMEDLERAALGCDQHAGVDHRAHGEGPTTG